jgi:hypothetical protein
MRRDMLWRQSGQLDSAEIDATRSNLHQPEKRLAQRRLAGAIAPQECHGLAGFNCQINPMKHLE